MEFDLVSLLFLFGALQSFLLLVGINLNKPLYSDLKKITSFLLLAIMIVMSYYVIGINQIESVFPYIDSLGVAFWMAVTPLFYLLCRCITDPKWMLTWKALIFFPVPLLFIVEGALTTMGFPVWIAQFFPADLFLDIWMATFFLSGLYFIGKSILLLRVQKEDQNIELTWFAYLFFTLLLVFQ